MAAAVPRPSGPVPSETQPSLLLSAVFPEGGALAEPATEERGFPPEILLEEMIPTLKLVIRAVRSEHQSAVKHP